MMKTKRQKSVANSTAGEALKSISIITLIIGIVVTIILLVECFQKIGDSYYSQTIVFNWITFSSCIEVFIGSIFICILGRTFAKIANYIEAIYKNINPDFPIDRLIFQGTRFIPGDLATTTEDNKTIKVTIIDSFENTDGYICFRCKKENGEEITKLNTQLESI